MERIDAAKTNEFRDQIFQSSDPNNPTGPMREDRSDLGVIKDGDDLKFIDDVVARAICPGESLGYVYVWYFDPLQNGAPTLTQYPVSIVVDRAPFDPTETPMPIFPENP